MRHADTLKGWAGAMSSGLDWAFREASRPLAGPLRHAGVRRRMDIVRPRADGRLVHAGVAQQSWLGHWRSLSTAQGRKGREAVILMPAGKVLRRRLVLGPAACAHAGDAVTHRFAELCPIPLDEALWSWRVAGPAPGGGCEVEIAIARRHEAEALLHAATGRGGTLAADLEEDGPVHILARREAAGARPAGLILALVVLAVAFAGWATGWRLDRDIAALEARREALLAESRTLRAEAEAAEMLAPIIARQNAYPDLDDVLRGLETGMAGLPDGMSIGTIATAQRELVLTDASPARREVLRERIGTNR